MPELFQSLKLETLNIEFKDMPLMVTEYVHLHCQLEAEILQGEKIELFTKSAFARESQTRIVLHTCPQNILPYFLNSQFIILWPPKSPDNTYTFPTLWGM